MGAKQSKTFEVPKNDATESKYEAEGLYANNPNASSSSEKPVASFRDPRSISDEVDRTPIQITSDKPKETIKSSAIPVPEKTSTGTSFADRIKAASLDRMHQEEEKKDSVQDELDSVEAETDKAKPTRGTEVSFNNNEEVAEIEEPQAGSSKMMENSTEIESPVPKSNEPERKQSFKMKFKSFIENLSPPRFKKQSQEEASEGSSSPKLSRDGKLSLDGKLSVDGKLSGSGDCPKNSLEDQFPPNKTSLESNINATFENSQFDQDDMIDGLPLECSKPVA